MLGRLQKQNILQYGQYTWKLSLIKARSYGPVHTIGQASKDYYTLTSPDFG